MVCELFFNKTVILKRETGGRKGGREGGTRSGEGKKGGSGVERDTKHLASRHQVHIRKLQ